MTIAEAIDEIVRSTDFFDHIAHLEQYAEEEKRRRKQFYKNLDEDTKAEFINGQVVIHSPVRLAHLEVSARVTGLLYLYVALHALGAVYTEKCLIHCERNDYEPDVCFFRKARSTTFAKNQMIFPPPDLVIEILSPSTASNDRTLKLHDYARHEIGEYWIIDADTQTVEQYTPIPGGNGYELKARLTGIERLSSAVVTGFEVPVKAFFDAEENQQALRDLSGRS